jgi:methylated-DNA-[protein]-cysteine S-methyltransferase
MAPAVYTVFETVLGVCGIAWNDRGVTAFQLPEATKRQTEDRLAKRAAAARADRIPKPIRAVIRKAQRHLEGDAQDFRDVAVDLDGTGPFARRVYEVARTIPAGRTTTYGELAARAGSPGGSRAVGRAMGTNPIPLIIPCHRVLAAGNRPGGFSAHGGLATKARMLEIEGATLGPPAVKRPKKDLLRAAEQPRDR